MSKRKKSDGSIGSFYTGDEIAKELAAQVATLKPQAVLDPACGDGRLLAAVREVLPNVPLYGVDNDEAAVAEAVANGFDAIIGDALFDPLPEADVWVMNPPYLGGNKISGSLGSKYFKSLQEKYGKHGRADYCSYWLRRAHLECPGPDAIVAVCTNTISQGDTRLAGLKHLVDNDWEITWAQTNREWKGEKASVTVSMFTIRRKYRSVLLLSRPLLV